MDDLRHSRLTVPERNCDESERKLSNSCLVTVERLGVNVIPFVGARVSPRRLRLPVVSGQVEHGFTHGTTKQ